MAFSELEKKKLEVQIQNFIDKRRPPIEIRDKLDISFVLKDQSVEIFEVRPHFQTGEKIYIPIAKSTYEKINNKWKIYWQRADLKWHSYEPKKTVKDISEFLKIVDEDKYHCFWG